MSEMSIALIGIGEVGGILAADLGGRASLTGFDKRQSEANAPAARNAKTFSVRCGANSAEASDGAQLIVSAVTAAETLNAAEAVATTRLHGAWYLDLNSASPGMKQQCAEAIGAAGGRYIEAAVMSPVPPKRLGTPILLGGPHANDFISVAEPLGFSALTVFSTELGKASAAKMCRSVMVKGIEALLTESLLAARSYGVEDTVLRSLDDLFPGPDWTALSRYMISRTLEHGARRAEEMREAARTVTEAGIEPHMSAATAERQDWASQFPAAAHHAELAEMLDVMRAAMNIREATP